MGATIVREDERLRAATWEGVFFEVWRGLGEPDQFRDLGALQIAYANTQPDGRIAHVSIVRVANITGFDAEARHAMEARTRAIDSKLRASTIVLPTAGFTASLVRGIIAGLTLVNRSKVPMKVAASNEEAMAWLAPQLPRRAGQPVTTAQLCAVCAPLLD